MTTYHPAGVILNAVAMANDMTTDELLTYQPKAKRRLSDAQKMAVWYLRFRGSVVEGDIARYFGKSRKWAHYSWNQAAALVQVDKDYARRFTRAGDLLAARKEVAA